MMKNKILLLINMLSIVISTEALAGKGIAIKLDVTDDAHNLINTKIRKASGEREMDNKYRHHVTIGFVENKKNMDDKALEKLGKSFIENIITKSKINSGNPLLYKVQTVGRFPKEDIILKPTLESENQLKELNKVVNKVIVELGYECNENTKVNKYTPHMSLYINPQDDTRIKQAVNNLKSTHSSKELYFKMFDFSYNII